MKIKAGSRATLVKSDRLLNVSFSVQAQTPMAKMLRPMSQKMTLKPNMTYFRQHETSLWFLLLRFALWLLLEGAGRLLATPVAP